MKELEAKAAQIGQAAAIKKANDPDITDQAAKMGAILDAEYKGSWLDGKDDLVEKYYQKGMRTLRIRSWPGHRYWGWFFTWPWGAITWLLIIVLLAGAFAPRPRLPAPLTDLSEIRTELTQIRTSLVSLEAMGAQLGEVNQQLEALNALAEKLKMSTPRQRKGWGNSFFKSPN
jgi:hypothetical protein